MLRNIDYFSDLSEHDVHPLNLFTINRGGSRTTTASKLEGFVIIVSVFQPLTIITKRSILDVAAVLDPPLINSNDKTER